ncbi:MAG: hypothetical protein ACOCQE_00725, partial [Halanaerobium sp.]
MLFKNKVVLILTVFILLFNLSTAAQEFGGGNFYSSGQETKTNIDGDIYPEFRIFSDGDIEENLKGELDLSYPGDIHEFKILMDYQIGAADQIEFNELYYKYYSDEYNILIGKNRLVWGKGDKVHVVDNINGEDLSDFINPDYLDRQIGEEMIKLDRYFRGGRANLEFVYTPDFTPNRTADDPDSPLGNWIIDPFNVEGFSLDEISNSLGYDQQELINKVEDSFEEEDNQFALRFTDSRGGTDYGFSYYKGYLREPSYDKSVFGDQEIDEVDDPQKFDQLLDSADLHYDEVDVFGFELARVIADINSRFELAYYRTDDTAGNDPKVRNNKIAWVVGGDKNLEISNLNLNIQFTGEKILDDDKIDSNSLDLQHRDDGEYTNHRAIVTLEDSYQNEKIIPKLSWVYNLRDNDYTLEAEVDYELQE